jgi:hypothetical protein
MSGSIIYSLSTQGGQYKFLASLSRHEIDFLRFQTIVLSADLIATRSPRMAYSCMACAEACKACASECDKFDSSEMKSCAKACHDCETTCKAMVKAMGHEHHD